MHISEKNLSTTLIDLESNKILLYQLIQKDKLNLILFYNNDCLGCTGRALPLAYNIQKKYPSINLIVIHSAFGENTYSTEDLNAMFTSGKSPFPIYMEKQHELYDSFNCDGTPHWVLINEKLEVLHSIFGSQEGAQMKLEYAIEEYNNHIDS